MIKLEEKMSCGIICSSFMLVFMELMFYFPTLQGLDDQVRCQDDTRIDSSRSRDHLAAEQDSDCGLHSDMVQKSWPFSHPISSAETY
jgi:hypothetical protein